MRDPPRLLAYSAISKGAVVLHPSHLATDMGRGDYGPCPLKWILSSCSAPPSKPSLGEVTAKSMILSVRPTITYYRRVPLSVKTDIRIVISTQNNPVYEVERNLNEKFARSGVRVIE